MLIKNVVIKVDKRRSKKKETHTYHYINLFKNALLKHETLRIVLKIVCKTNMCMGEKNISIRVVKEKKINLRPLHVRALDHPTHHV